MSSNSSLDTKESHAPSTRTGGALENRFYSEYPKIEYRFRPYVIKIIGNKINRLSNIHPRVYNLGNFSRNHETDLIKRGPRNGEMDY